MFPEALVTEARELLATLETRGLMLATAESCTGGLIAGLLTTIAGSSRAFDRGFVTYSNAAKTQMLGVATDLIETHGAVSEAVARAMAEGALRQSSCHIAVSVTGIAGPDGGSATKPVGRVLLACARLKGETLHVAHTFADDGREAIRMAAVAAALGLVRETLD